MIRDKIVIPFLTPRDDIFFSFPVYPGREDECLEKLSNLSKSRKILEEQRTEIVIDTDFIIDVLADAVEETAFNDIAFSVASILKDFFENIYFDKEIGYVFVHDRKRFYFPIFDGLIDNMGNITGFDWTNDTFLSTLSCEEIEIINTSIILEYYRE